MGVFVSICLRLTAALYMIASAFAGFDFCALGRSERIIRIVLGIAILATSAFIFAPALIAGGALVFLSFRQARLAKTTGNI